MSKTLVAQIDLVTFRPKYSRYKIHIWTFRTPRKRRQACTESNCELISHWTHAHTKKEATCLWASQTTQKHNFYASVLTTAVVSFQAARPCIHVGFFNINLRSAFKCLQIWDEGHLGLKNELITFWGSNDTLTVTLCQFLSYQRYSSMSG